MRFGQVVSGEFRPAKTNQPTQTASPMKNRGRLVGTKQTAAFVANLRSIATNGVAARQTGVGVLLHKPWMTPAYAKMLVPLSECGPKVVTSLFSIIPCCRTARRFCDRKLHRHINRDGLAEITENSRAKSKKNAAFFVGLEVVQGFLF